MKKENTDKLWLMTLSECNEVQRRRLAGIKAIEIGRGGILEVCKLTGMSHHTVIKGMREVRNTKRKPSTRIRKEGGGRKKIVEKNPEVKKDIENILEENTAGDPISGLKWTNKSTYAIAEELKSKGKNISEVTAGRIIKKEGYTLQLNKKSKENGSPKERDSQFRYINERIKECNEKYIPFVSVDTKKKELIGNFKNNGQRWHKTGEAEIVNVYDYESLSNGKAIPYGIYDIIKNNGFVNIGVDHNTSEFAVASIEKWWEKIGQKNYHGARELFISADCGGSNSSRSKLWKYYLQKFSNKTKIKITVLHYPPGTSKWNKIEHKMFSFISLNWKGKPLLNYEIIINLIKNTKTKQGLKIEARIDQKRYELKKEITQKQLEKIKIENHKINPQWNYTIIPE